MNTNNWKYVDALEFCSKITDGTHDSPKSSTDGKPLITSKHIKGRNIDFETAYLISEEDFTKINIRSKVDQWDVIISMIGEYCGFCYIERNENIDYAVKNVGLFKTGSKIKADWLYYYLTSSQGKQVLDKIKTGSSQPYLTLGSLRNLKILVPTNDKIQEKIIAILSSLDSKIELNNHINAELEGMAKLIYDYWFVQFDFPDADGKPYKTSGGKMVWNKELKREIPEGWEVKKIGDVSEIKAGGDKPKAISKVKTATYQVPIYSNGISDEGLYGYTENAKIFSNSITISARGTIGYSVIRLKPYVPIIRLITVIPNNYYELNFLYQEIQRLSFEDSGSVQKQLTVPQISELKVVIPSIELIKKYHQLSYVGLTKIDGNKEENQKLTELRDWLLPMLMNGQVRVGEVEIEKEEELRMVVDARERYQRN